MFTDFKYLPLVILIYLYISLGCLPLCFKYSPHYDTTEVYNPLGYSFMGGLKQSRIDFLLKERCVLLTTAPRSGYKCDILHRYMWSVYLYDGVMSLSFYKAERVNSFVTYLMEIMLSCYFCIYRNIDFHRLYCL